MTPLRLCFEGEVIVQRDVSFINNCLCICRHVVKILNKNTVLPHNTGTVISIVSNNL